MRCFHRVRDQIELVFEACAREYGGSYGSTNLAVSGSRERPNFIQNAAQTSKRLYRL